MAGRFSVEAVFKAVDRVTAPVSRMQNKVGKFTRSIGRRFHKANKFVEKFSNGIKQGALIGAAAVGALGVALGKIVMTGAKFEQTIVNAAAKFPGAIRKGTKAFKALEDAARTTGKTTEFTASQSAEALNFLAMAGFSAEGAIAALPGVVDLATAASIELAEATDIVSDSLGAFGLATKDAAQLGKNLSRVNDVMAKTATTANTTIQDMFEAIKEAGPIATTAGASIETVSALIGELANSGIKGTRAGTTLKNMFVRLAAPAGKGASLLKKFGIQTKDANGDMLDIVDVLGDLDEKLAGLGTAERTGVLEGIFGKIPLAGVNVLLKSGADRLRKYRHELENASGASAEMAAVMRDTVQGRLNALKSAVEGVSISIFGMTKGPLADIIEETTKWVRANEQVIAKDVGKFIRDAIPPLKTFAKIIGGIVKFIYQLGAGLGITAAKIIIATENLINSTAGFFEDRFGEISEDFNQLIHGSGSPQVTGPQQRATDQRATTTNTAEVTIKDETGRAEVSGGTLGSNIKLQPTGAF